MHLENFEKFRRCNYHDEVRCVKHILQDYLYNRNRSSDKKCLPPCKGVNFEANKVTVSQETYCVRAFLNWNFSVSWFEWPCWIHHQKTAQCSRWYDHILYRNRVRNASNWDQRRKRCVSVGLVYRSISLSSRTIKVCWNERWSFCLSTHQYDLYLTSIQIWNQYKISSRATFAEFLRPLVTFGPISKCWP